MDASKVKNIVIIILLLLNAFLAAAVISDSYDRASARRSEIKMIEQILGDHGITLRDGVSLSVETSGSYALIRDLSKEEQRVRRLLSSVTVSTTGGGAYVYYGAGGQAVFRGSGEFDILMNADAVSEGRDSAKTAASVMKKLGIDIYGELTQIMEDNGDALVTMTASFEGLPVFNARTTLNFTNGYLFMVSGVRAFDNRTEKNGEGSPGVVDAVISFLKIMQENGHVCSYIEKLETGYIISSTVLGEGVLTPVWYFATDTFEVYINAATGAAETFAQG